MIKGKKKKKEKKRKGNGLFVARLSEGIYITMKEFSSLKEYYKTKL